MSENKPEFLQAEPSSNADVDHKDADKHASSGYKVVWISAAVGAVFSIILPVIVVIWKIDLCNYGLGDDISGVCICIPPFMLIGAAVGAVIGLIGKGISSLLRDRTNIARHELIGIVTASLLAAVAGVAISTVPAFMLAFPDC
jgi:hypothetical protein